MTILFNINIDTTKKKISECLIYHQLCLPERHFVNSIIMTFNISIYIFLNVWCGYAFATAIYNKG